jgi:hypothetical protein
MNKDVLLKNVVLDEAKKGNLVIHTIEGFALANIDEFIKQPLDGILYDLNRLPEVVLSFIDDSKWVNDYAVYLVIKRMKEKLGELEEKNRRLTEAFNKIPTEVM